MSKPRLPADTIKTTPVWQCIYCGQRRREYLTDEHIIPFSLNGNLVLAKSSCRECNSITHSFEGYVAGSMMGQFRHAKGLQTRRRKPGTIPLWVEFEDRCEIVDVKAGDHPGIFPILRFDQMPPIITNIEEEPTMTVMLRGFLDKGNPAYTGAKKIHGRSSIHAIKFSRMLAKIAHAFAIKELGVCGYIYDIPRFILNNDPNVINYVGCHSEPRGEYTKPDHLLYFTFPESIFGTIIVVNIVLFANWTDMPVYMVAVGRPNHLTEERLESSPFYPEEN